MAETTTTTQYVREAPNIEAYKLGLYQDAQKYIRDLQAQGIQPPAQGIAGFTSEQLAAGDVIRSGIGGYEPYLGGALSANQAAQQMIAQGSAPLLQESLAQQQAGISGLQQAQQLALAQRQAPFQLRDQALRGLSGAATDIARAGAGVGNQVFAAQQGLGRAGQLGQQAAQQAAAQQLRQAQLTGQLGQTIGALGTQTAGLGQLGQQMGVQDINTLLGAGALQQGQDQRSLDVARANSLAQQALPYQQVGFMSDIFRGVPALQQTYSTTTSPGPSASSQALGLGIAGLGAYGMANRGTGNFLGMGANN